jgi:hypothetical protein
MPQNLTRIPTRLRASREITPDKALGREVAGRYGLTFAGRSPSVTETVRF